MGPVPSGRYPQLSLAPGADAADTPFMGASAADTPATPESLRASDAERDRAISALQREFIEGRLSHETFMFRMQSALGARHRGQLVGLFTDLPPRRARFLDRIRAAFRRQDRNPDSTAERWRPGPQPIPGMPAPPGAIYRAPPGAVEAGGWAPQPALWTSVHGGPDGPGGSGHPMPMVFPPGHGTTFIIGRTQDSDMRIADLSVSRRHAQLSRDQDGWLLRDLGSHNGTRVNGWLVREPVPVRPGDLLQFGSALFIIKGPEQGPEPAEGPESPPEGGPGGTGGGQPPVAGGSGGGPPVQSTL
jgi:hypothetical protein